VARPESLGTLLLSAYAWLQWLSVDVAIGALAGGLLAQRICGVALDAVWYVVLPISVWVIYTLDHLLDARRLGAGAHTARHLFHHRYFKEIAAVMALLGALALVLAIWGMGLRGLAFGVGMAALAGGHLLLVRWAGSRVAPWLLKELGVGVVYVLGIWGWPLLSAWPAIGGAMLLPLLQYMALALANLLAFSWYERDSDAADGHTSFVRAIGSRAAQGCIWGLLLVVLAGGPLGLALGWQMDWAVQAVLGGMALVTGTLLVWPKWMTQGERYRLVGDGVFLLPFLLALLAGR
jgi:hypothetical protein